MSLTHFLHEYAEHPFLGPYYEHWLSDSNFGTFGHIWRPNWDSFHPSGRQPPVEWYEDETLYTVQIEIPGVRKEDISMHVTEDGRSLKIEGKAEKFGGVHALGTGEEESRDRLRPRITKVRKTMSDGTIIIISRTVKKHATASTVKFSRTISLPGEVDGKRVGAKLENGVLTVTVPKLNTHKPRRIVID